MSTIRSLDSFTVQYPEPNDNVSLRYLTFARVRSDDGTEGWGEAITQFPAAAKATEVLIDGLAEMLVGRDPNANVAIWREIVDASWWYGYRGGVASFALSAVDIALWDLKGKLAGLPLIDLLGGSRRQTLPVIASTHAFNPSIEHEAERHGAYVREQGYLGVKIGMGKKGEARLGYDLARDLDFFARLREACGPDAWLMMDRGQSLRWTLDETIARVRGFEEQGLMWMEEPFEPWQTDELETLRGKVDCMFAGAEREWDVRGYEQALEPGLIDVVGCDVGRVGGITGALRVIRLVEERGKWFNSHAWSGAINTAVSIALSASTDRCLLQELKPDASPMQHELVEVPIAASNGQVAIPRSPGIGVVPIQAVIDKYRF